MNDLHNINLSERSKLLITYYNELKKTSNKELAFSQIGSTTFAKNKKNYINFQKYLFNKLEDFYKKLKVDLCLDSNMDLTKYRKFYYASTDDYKNNVKRIYNAHFHNNRYITNETKNFIKSGSLERENCLLTYELPYKKTKLIINFFIYKNSGISHKNIAYYDTKAFHMLALVNLITLLTNNNAIYETGDYHICSKDGLNINLFLTPFERTIEQSDKILGAKNVNGGFCYGCVNAGTIVVYRFEEWFKVFVHECVHNFGVDRYIWKFTSSLKSSFNNEESKIYNDFINTFNLSNKVNNNSFDLGLQECVVEFWGEFLNNAIYSYNYSKHCILSKNANKQFIIYYNTFETIIQTEILHGLLQTTKILQKNAMNFERMLNVSQNNAKNSYDETSHLFSYYILKMFITYDYKSFINSEISLSNDFKIIFNNSEKLETMDYFFKYIISNFKNPKLISNIQLVEELYEFLKTNKTCKELQFIVENLRMSVLEY